MLIVGPLPAKRENLLHLRVHHWINGEVRPPTPMEQAMNIEDAFVRDMLANPEEGTARLVYADWLEEKGHPQSLARAEFLRGQIKLSGLDPEAPQRPTLEARQRQLCEQVGDEWMTRVAQSVIEQCEPRFAYHCPQKWDKLTPTDDAQTRFCDVCRKGVHFCHTIQEAQHHAWEGHCVALNLQVERTPGDLISPTEVTMGLMIDPSFPSESEGVEVLPTGTLVCVREGNHQGHQGEVLGFEGDGSQVWVKLVDHEERRVVSVAPQEIEVIS